MIGFLRAILLSCAFALAPAALAQEPLTVFVAASMKDALEEAAQDFEAGGGGKVVFSLAASSVLAKQIEAGAPADAFVSADLAWMDWLVERDLIQPETRRVVAGNRLVIAASRTSETDPAALLAERFAMGDPAHVPAGRYAQAALEHLGLWSAVQTNAVFGENVRVALELVRRGEVGAAIVYASDLNPVPELKAAYTFPDETHPPIVYPAALVAGGDEGAAFLDFLSGEAGQRIFFEHGFSAAP